MLSLDVATDNFLIYFISTQMSDKLGAKGRLAKKAKTTADDDQEYREQHSSEGEDDSRTHMRKPTALGSGQRGVGEQMDADEDAFIESNQSQQLLKQPQRKLPAKVLPPIKSAQTETSPNGRKKLLAQKLQQKREIQSKQGGSEIQLPRKLEDSKQGPSEKHLIELIGATAGDMSGTPTSFQTRRETQDLQKLHGLASLKTSQELLEISERNKRMQKKNSQQQIDTSKVQELALERDDDDDDDNIGESQLGAAAEPDAREDDNSDSGAEDEEYKKREPEQPTPPVDQARTQYARQGQIAPTKNSSLLNLDQLQLHKTTPSSLDVGGTRYFLLPNETCKKDEHYTRDQLKRIYSDRMTLKLYNLWVNSTHTRAIALHSDKLTFLDYSLDPVIQYSGRNYTYKPTAIQQKATPAGGEDHPKIQRINRFAFSEDGCMLVVSDKYSIGVAKMSKPFEFLNPGMPAKKKIEIQINESAHRINQFDKDTSFSAVNRSAHEHQGLINEATGIFITPVSNHLVLIIELKQPATSTDKNITQIYRSVDPLQVLITKMSSEGSDKRFNLEDTSETRLFQKLIIPSDTDGDDSALYNVDKQLGSAGIFVIRRDYDGMPFIYNAETDKLIEHEMSLRSINVNSSSLPQRQLTSSLNAKSGISKRRGFERNAESGFYYPMDELLIIKYEDRVQLYKKIGGIKDEFGIDLRDESWIEYPKKPMVKFPKKLLENYQILKVYEDYIFFIKSLDRMSVKVMNIQTGKIEQAMKLLAPAHPYHQFLHQPHITTSNGFENIFFPKPLVSYTGLRPSLHLQDKKREHKFITSNGVPILPTTLRTFERQNGGLSQVKPGEQAKDIDYYLSNSEYKLVDYITERRIGVFTHTVENQPPGILIVSFQPSFRGVQSCLLQERLDQFIFRGVLMEQLNDQFKTKKVYQLFFSTGNALKLLNIDPLNIKQSKALLIAEFTYEDAAKDEELGSTKKNNLLSGIKTGLFNQMKGSEAVETVKPVTSIQYFYCRENNEIVVSGKIRARGSEDYLVVLPLRYDPEEGRIVALETRPLIDGPKSPLNSVKIMLYSKRMLYFNELKSGTFTVQPLDEQYRVIKDKKIIFSQIRGLESAVQLPSCVILYTEDDMLYITDSQGVNVKSVIKNLYTGDLVQDRSDPGIVYCVDYQADRIERVNLFNSHPTSIPYNLMIKEDLFTKYDDDSCQLNFYESIDKSEEHQMLSFLKLRTAHDSKLDFRRQIQRRIGLQRNYIHTIQEIIEFPRRMAIKDVLSYNVINRKHFFNDAIELNDDAIMESVLKKLEVTNPEKVPFLFPGSGIAANKRNIFSKAIERNKNIYVKQFISLMTTCDPKGLIYQKYVDFMLTELLEKRIDIKSYFCSSMPIHKIPYNKFYVQYSSDDRSLMIPCNAESIQQIERNFKRFVEPALTEYDGFIPCCRKQKDPDYDEELGDIRDQSDEEREEVEIKRHERKTGEKVDKEKWGRQITSQGATENEDEDANREVLHEIEYLIINLKAVFTSSNKKLFMQQILQAATDDITYLDIPVLQSVIDFKWMAYTKAHFVIDLIKTVIFVISFIIDIITLSPAGWPEESHDYFLACVVTRSICGAYMVDFFINEMRQLRHEGLYTYLTKDIWNFCDLTLFGLYCAYVPVSFIYKGEEYTVKVIQCAIMMFIQIKVNFYLRIFDKFGYLVQMVTTVFYDLRYFILYFFIILAFFSIEISIYMKDVDDHEGIGSAMYFMMVLRTALGDNDIDQEFTEYKILFWIVWVIIMLVSNIVLMNFIIAVVGESYEACMSKMIAQSYKGKVDMIVELEQIMFKSQFENKKYFPNYIIIRRPVDSNNDAQEGEGFRIMEISREVKHMAEQINEIKQELRHSVTAAREEAAQSQQFVNDMREQMLTLVDFATKMSQAHNIQIEIPNRRDGYSGDQDR